MSGKAIAKLVVNNEKTEVKAIFPALYKWTEDNSIYLFLDEKTAIVIIDGALNDEIGVIIRTVNFRERYWERLPKSESVTIYNS